MTLDDLPEKRVRVTGVGQSAVGRPSPRSAFQLTLDACLQAIDDAGLAVDEIDGVVNHFGKVAGAGARERQVRRDVRQELRTRLIDVLVGRELGRFGAGQRRIGSARFLVDLHEIVGMRQWSAESQRQGQRQAACAHHRFHPRKNPESLRRTLTARSGAAVRRA